MNGPRIPCLLLLACFLPTQGCAEGAGPQAATPSDDSADLSSMLCDPSVERSSKEDRPRDPAKRRRTAAAIQATIRKSYPQIRACYEDALGRNPKTAGKMLMHFVIAEPGTVTEACILKVPFPDPPSLACILREFRSLTFGSTDAKTTVNYPLEFEPGQSAESSQAPQAS